MSIKVSIQGYEGSFHQVAAQKFFGKKVEVIPCATFRDVIKIGKDKIKSDGCVMAIENSIAGSILPNYTLLQKSNLIITGEVYLSITQNLLANPGVQLADIKEVHSHPMALLQCIDYLEINKWKLVETDDTALSAKHIHQHKSKHIAAIASTLAAKLYNLKILAPAIQTNKKNYTRFLILQRANSFEPIIDANKASINFTTNHSKGELAKVLMVIAEADLNLSKLQSFPIPGSNFNYSFHADVEFEDVQKFNQTIEKLKVITEDLKIYGVYKNGNK
jgi:prephenate dehydratase